MGVDILGQDKVIQSKPFYGKPSNSDIIYVAGPYTSALPYEIDQHILNAEKVALALISWGFTVLTPHKNNSNYERYEGLLNLNNDYWVQSDLMILARCDAICMLPDWKKSGGAKVEHTQAQQAQIPIFLAEFTDV